MSTFEPDIARASLKKLQGTKAEQQEFELQYKESVQNRVASWLKTRTKTRTAQVDLPEQLEWAANVIQYVLYVHKATSVHGLAKKGTASPVLAKDVPFLGPRFLPPSYLLLQKRNPEADIKPSTAYLKPLHVVHPFYYPELAVCPQCSSDDISWEGFTTTGPRLVHGMAREETAIGAQLKCKPCMSRFGKDGPEEGMYCFATTNPTFWERKQHWEIPAGIPHFSKRSAVTRDLYNLIVEVRPSTTSGGLAENIKQLHLLEYSKAKLEYLQSWETQKQSGLFKKGPTPLQVFSDPDDARGYGERPITDDLITDLFLEFSERTRRSESEDYMKTLTAICMSMDNTVKVRSKATVIDKDKTHIVLMKGGVLSILNENNEIIAWRFCQSASHAEAREILEGIERRCTALSVPCPVMVIVDNCCTVRAYLTGPIPGIEVCLDVWHFRERYLAVVLGGMKNAYRSEVSKDITESIIKQRAHKGTPATYWSQSEQVEKLDAAYIKWAKKGGVWSAAARETHYNGMGHVRRGCLSRARQDISTDGSRQEGSHKGWNGIQRAVSSGIELFTALAHDFVLRRNCRIAARGKTPSDFSMASHGTHHIRLANHIAERWNQDLETDKGSRSVGVGLKKLPTLPQVASDEKFGLVVSEYTNNFKGLLEIKEEAEPLPDFDGPDDDLGRDLFTASDMMKSLNIDPALLDLPQAPVDTEVVAGSSNTVPLRIESGSPPPVSSTSLVVKSELLPGSKRKSTHLGDQQSASEEALGSKRPRIQILQPIGLPGPSGTLARSSSSVLPTLQGFFANKMMGREPVKPASVPAQSSPPPAVDVFSLPVGPKLHHLTRSQRVFSIATAIDIRSLHITGDVEFFLFMRMRAEKKWTCNKMKTGVMWVEATNEFNKQLVEANAKSNLPTIKKNPRALLDKLATVEATVLKRLFTGDFVSKRTGTDTFWKEACHAVSFDGVKIEDLSQDTQDLPELEESEDPQEATRAPSTKTKPRLSRRPACCARCHRIMYPGPAGSPENHKRGSCSDGAKSLLAASDQNRDPEQPDKVATTSPLEYPLPKGIFTAGTNFHPLVFIATLRDIYEKVVVSQVGDDTLLEYQAFASLLIRRTLLLEDRTVLFKMIDCEVPTSTPEGLITIVDGLKYLRLDCLQEPEPELESSASNEEG